MIKLNNNNFVQIHTFPEIFYSEVVDLSFNRLHSFPEISHADIKYLKLNDNIFECITDEMFRDSDGSGASQLVLLDMSRNEIKNISATSFLDLLNLEYLKLSQNQLIKIENGTFINLIKLIELDLSRNHLTKLDKSLLKSSRFLLKLNLSSNKLEFLERELFMNLKQLVNLDISNNSIKSISFLNVGLAKLTDLNIQFNLVTTFEPLYGLDSMANVFVPSDLLNTFENIETLIKSFVKKKSVKSRVISLRNNDSIQYFKSVNVFYPKNQANSSFFKTDRDCFNVLYLIRFQIILNLSDKEHLELFMSECECFIHQLFEK